MPEFIVVVPYGKTKEQALALNVNHIIMIEPSPSGREARGARITVSINTRTIEIAVEHSFLELTEWVQ